MPNEQNRTEHKHTTNRWEKVGEYKLMSVENYSINSIYLRNETRAADGEVAQKIQVFSKLSECNQIFLSKPFTQCEQCFCTRSRTNGTQTKLLLTELIRANLDIFITIVMNALHSFGSLFSLWFHEHIFFVGTFAFFFLLFNSVNMQNDTRNGHKERREKSASENAIKVAFRNRFCAHYF